MRVRSTGPVTYLTGQRRELTGRKMYSLVRWSVGWSLVTPTFPRMSYHCTQFFLRFVFCCSILWCARGQDKEKVTHPHFDVPVSSYPLVVAIPLTRWLLIPSRWTSYCSCAASEGKHSWSGASVSRGHNPWRSGACCRCCWCVLMFICSSCSGRGGVLVSIYWRWLCCFSPYNSIQPGVRPITYSPSLAPGIYFFYTLWYALGVRNIDPRAAFRQEAASTLQISTPRIT